MIWKGRLIKDTWTIDLHQFHLLAYFYRGNCFVISDTVNFNICSPSVFCNAPVAILIAKKGIKTKLKNRKTKHSLNIVVTTAQQYKTKWQSFKQRQEQNSHHQFMQVSIMLQF